MAAEYKHPTHEHTIALCFGAVAILLRHKQYHRSTIVCSVCKYALRIQWLCAVQLLFLQIFMSWSKSCYEK